MYLEFPHVYAFLLPRRCFIPRLAALGAEKKSGVPYILTSAGRHRQTPATKHDQKTRHVGLAHVAQPSYLALSYFGEVFQQARYAVAYVAGGLSGLPSSSEGSGHAGRVTLPWDPRFCLNSLGGGGRWATALSADGDGTPSLPFGRAGARPSLGFGPVAGRSSPRNRVTKSCTRRCQRSILPSPSQFLSRECGESIPHSPAAFKR